jgi:hypothetical protein
MGRTLYFPPVNPAAEPVCTLDRATALGRQEAPDKFLDDAFAQESTPTGMEYRFQRTDEMWERVQIFIQEEAQCCPFFAFEVAEREQDLVLTIFRP